MSHPFEPDWTMHPGAILGEELKFRGMNGNELAVASGLDLDTVTGLLDFTAPVTEEIAERLFSALGISAQFWLNGQRIYEEALARGAKDVSEEYQ
jgi:plasmid maintenance system antidote protein VapI